MAEQTRIVRDQVDRDAISLRQIAEKRWTLFADCPNCRHTSLINTLDLIAKTGSTDTTLGMIRHRMACDRCKKLGPYLLMKNPGIRGDMAWYPHPPMRTR